MTTPLLAEHLRALEQGSAPVAAQQPVWADAERLAEVRRQLSTAPPPVVSGECDALREHLAAVSRGEAFLLQGGDCAETFGATAKQIRDKLKVLLQMAVVLTYGAATPVVKVGRIAGQFAKPRSAHTEVVVGPEGPVELPSYRGDAVNGVLPTAEARVADAGRLLQAHASAVTTLNLLRALTGGGFADIEQVHSWNRDFVRASPVGQRYERMARDIERALGFLRATGTDTSTLRSVELFTSHEALLLDYELPFARFAEMRGRVYGLSAHMLWIGERTRALDGAHVRFARQVANPLGVKLGPTATPADAVALCEALDPERTPGRLTLITRLGAERVREVLPGLVRAVEAAGHPVVWACDPMHGNTRTTVGGVKTRHVDDVVEEVRGFFEVHHALGTHPGGLHVEITGDDVTECLGGGHDVTEADLGYFYETACDPRLNATQSLDLAFLAAGMLQDARG